MKKVLYIFGHLNNQDVEWLAANGRKVRLKKSEAIVSKGEESRHLYIILEGSLAVMAGEDNSVRLASLGSGEVVGEMSFLDGSTPSATVLAETDSVVFSILKNRMEDKIRSDEGFGLRLYKALALFLTARLRVINAKYTKASLNENTDDDESAIDELDSTMADNVGEAGRRFSRLLSLMQDL